MLEQVVAVGMRFSAASSGADGERLEYPPDGRQTGIYAVVTQSPSRPALRSSMVARKNTDTIWA